MLLRWVVLPLHCFTYQQNYGCWRYRSMGVKLSVMTLSCLDSYQTASVGINHLTAQVRSWQPSVPADWRTSTYSYYAAPVEGSSWYSLVTSCMTNRGMLVLRINRHGLQASSLRWMKMILQLFLRWPTKDWRINESLVHVADQNSAKLPNEGL